MGAVHKFDLTSDVTHLIVGEYDTPKYRYVAKERQDVKIMLPSWIEAVRELWIQDKPVNLAALEQENTLPAFYGLRICMTGFEDQEQRQQIISLVTDNGADYHGDLTKQITHLVVFKPDGAKYKHAKSWGLKLVSLEWLCDSAKRGMILQEELYNPEWPASERGKGAWIKKRIISPGKRSRDDSIGDLEGGKRKIRRTASTKLTSQNENIWGDIVGGANGVQVAESGVWEGPVVAGVGKTEDVKGAPRPAAPAIIPVATEPIRPQDFLHGRQFYIEGFERKKYDVLANHIFSRGGTVVDSPDSLNAVAAVSSIMVPHDWPASKVATPSPEISVVTEFWLEQCIWTKTLVSPFNYLLGRPLGDGFRNQLQGFTVCSTGFEGSALRHLSIVVKLAGGKYDEFFSKSASVLICDLTKRVRREKLLSAHAWEIPAVSLDWLIDSIMSGEKQLFRKYLVRMKRTASMNGETTAIEKEPEDRRSNNENTEHHPGDTTSKERGPRAAQRPDTSAFDNDPPRKMEEAEATAKSLETTRTVPPQEVPLEAQRDPPLPSKSPRKSPLRPRPNRDTTLARASSTTVAEDALVSSLLLKSKSTSLIGNENMDSSRSTDGTHRKRVPGRILGRAPSNASVVSRASSVDSTASKGEAVQWTISKASSGHGGSEQQRGTDSTGSALSTKENDRPAVSSVLEGLLAQTDCREEEAPPPQTQMHYEDTESAEYKAQMLARVTGKTYVRKEKARVATISNIKTQTSSAGATGRAGRVLRDRQSAVTSGLR
jgi:DNA replication regulator DPB11